MDKRRIAFQGETGAYSEEAILQYFQESVETVPCRTLSDVFKGVEGEGADLGLVPVENSLHGSIVRTYDLLLSSKLKICGETILRVKHCLISNPDTELQGVRTVYSHPQALAQCRVFLEGRSLEGVAAYDTAGSVKMIAEKNLMDSAAIAGERAAKVYGMKILAKGIETNHNNYTRFFIIGREEYDFTGDDKTSLVFSTKHEPGSLFRVLKEFAVRRINLTKIESRPIISRPFEYNFYLDLEGHREENIVKEALNGVRERTAFMKVLGSYPRAREYAVQDT